MALRIGFNGSKPPEYSVSDIEWVKKVLETKMSSQFIDTVKTIVEKISQNTDKGDVASNISEAFTNLIINVPDNKKV